ncbi:MAG: cobD [Deltaproteobacteria bacterium]|nr:cobD [Deltaproteobacteria bacterium]
MKRNIPDIHDFASDRKISAHRVMDFTNSANPLGPSSHARNAIRKSIKMIDRPVDHRARYLARSLARLHDVPEDNIVASGSFDALLTAITRSFNAGTVLCCAPYPSYYRKVVEGPVNFHFLDLEEREHFLFDRVLWEEQLPVCDAAIISYPSFISERPLSHDDVRRMIAIAEDRGMLLIIDETFIQYSLADSAAGDIAGHPHCFIISSLTEYYALQGLPVSYCIGEASALAALRQRFPISAPSALAAAAAAGSIRDRVYPRQTRTYFADEHTFIQEGLGKIPGISFYTTACGSFVIKFSGPPLKTLDTFSRYNILVDAISGSLFFPVKNHKWNARYLKTLKNIMGKQYNETL